MTKTLRILVVDDEPTNVEIVVGMLSHGGYTNIETTTDSDEVESLVQSFQPDLLLLDWRMPEKDGAAVLRALALAGLLLHVKVWILTADELLPLMVATRHGATKVLRKPLDLRALLILIKEFDAHRTCQPSLPAA